MAPHAFLTRTSAGGPSESLVAGLERVGRQLGLAAERVHDARQVHGTASWIASGPRRAGHSPEADILVTNEDSQAVAVRTADCVPLLLADVRCGAVAAVHAGWRGTCAGAAVRAVDLLRETFDTAPADLVVALGPSIGPCCYEVAADVCTAFDARAHGMRDPGAWFLPRGDRWSLDLWAANADQMRAAGVPASAIHVSGLCTSCRVAEFYSFRRDGAGTGRLWSAIRPALR